MVNKSFFTSVAVLVGTCVGAGILGIPYVASRAGFPLAVFYLIFIGALILLLNLYLGEISLRTKENHQIVGYAEKYLGAKGRKLMRFATLFGIYSALVAYMVGVGDSLSFLFFDSGKFSIFFGLFFGGIMSFLLLYGTRALKRYERLGVLIIISLLLMIFIFFVNDISSPNLQRMDFGNFLLPFGVVLFALMSFHAIPEINLILGKNKKLMKKVLITGVLVSVLIYLIFALTVVGSMGLETPQVATLALGKLFVIFGIFTMFTSHLSLENALDEEYILDESLSKKRAWFLSCLIPIVIYLAISFLDFFSFTRILSIGGVVSGGLMGILILLMAYSAKTNGDRKPEYSIEINEYIIGFVGLIFVLGVVREIIISLRIF